MFDFGTANDEQKKAITATEGPVLIIAGPGTGKTYTLVKRISYLVFEKKVSPSSIMAVTFTEKAARELLTRISDEFIATDKNCNININEMYIGTFHSICLRLLKENSTAISGSRQSRIIDSFEQTYFVCRNIDYFRKLHDFNEHFPVFYGDWKQSSEICRYVNQLSEELVDIEKMEDDTDPDMRFLGRLVEKYEELLRKNNLMDFSSIQAEARKLIVDNESIRHAIQDKFRYVMVDEYQDTNYIQEQLVLMIAEKQKNICVVGDDDQGMYRFRGATIRNILEFPDKFKKNECKIIHLNDNYRSEPGIIDFYSYWMESSAEVNLFNWDKYRYPKQLRAKKSNIRSGNSVFSCGGNAKGEEQQELLKMIKTLKENGNISNLNQIAFLFKSVKSKEAVELAAFLESNGIPVYSPRSDMFFERREVKQILGCFIFCFKRYTEDLRTNNFRYPISDKLRNYYISCRAEALTLLKSDNSLYRYICETASGIANFCGESNYGLLDIFYKLLAFRPFCEYLCKDVNANAVETRAARNLAEISRMLAKYRFLHNMHFLTQDNKNEAAEQLFNVYFKYLYIDGVGEYEDASEYAPNGCVSFMTIHQAKGMEFPVVVVGSLGSTPRRNSDPLMLAVENRFFHRLPYEPLADIKYFDFWRLYYVAFSRAQNLLVTAVKRDGGIFKEILQGLPDISSFCSTERFEDIKSVKYKHVYSFTSHIGIYEGCPTQYKFYKEYGFAQNKMFHTSVGSLVHATLEDMNKCIINGNIDHVNEAAIKEWFALNYRSMQEQTGFFLTDEQTNSALQQVLRYYFHRKDELGKVWKAEEEINLVLPDYILQGVIDLVAGKNDTVEIVDYKTGPKPDGDPYRKVGHYKKQLEIYAYLIEKRYSKKVDKMHLYYTSTIEGDPLISFDRKKEEMNKTISEITQTVRNIEEKNFKGKSTNSYACKMCDMRYYCNNKED